MGNYFLDILYIGPNLLKELHFLDNSCLKSSPLSYKSRS